MWFLGTLLCVLLVTTDVLRSTIRGGTEETLVALARRVGRHVVATPPGRPLGGDDALVVVSTLLGVTVAALLAVAALDLYGPSSSSSLTAPRVALVQHVAVLSVLAGVLSAATALTTTRTSGPTGLSLVVLLLAGLCVYVAAVVKSLPATSLERERALATATRARALLVAARGELSRRAPHGPGRLRAWPLDVWVGASSWAAAVGLGAVALPSPTPVSDDGQRAFTVVTVVGLLVVTVVLSAMTDRWLLGSTVGRILGDAVARTVDLLGGVLVVVVITVSALPLLLSVPAAAGVFLLLTAGPLVGRTVVHLRRGRRQRAALLRRLDRSIGRYDGIIATVREGAVHPPWTQPSDGSVDRERGARRPTTAASALVALLLGFFLGSRWSSGRR